MKKTMFIAVMAIMALLTVFTGCNNASNSVSETKEQDGLAFVLKLPGKSNQRSAYYEQSDAEWYDIQIEQVGYWGSGIRGLPGETVRLEVPGEGWYRISVAAYNGYGSLIADGWQEAYISETDGDVVITITINPRKKQIGFYIEIIWAPAPDDDPNNNNIGYPLRTGKEINSILKELSPCDESEYVDTGNKFYSYRVENFIRSYQLVDTNYYLDLSNKVPVWYDEEKKTIYYYIQENDRLVLNPDSRHMFAGLDQLQFVDLSQFDTDNVNYMDYMFYDCKSLTSLDITFFHTQNVMSMCFMFQGCESLQELDIRHFEMYRMPDIYGFFNNCSSLEYIYAWSDTDWMKYYKNSDTQLFLGCNSLPDYTDEKTTLEYAHTGYFNGIKGYFTEIQ